ncbi:hypothetical protein [Hanstruepera marina]|uniref:hypothetical protein n=1 Tax=Hanstruepera marina TaxID=2873265 RepID=UPI001CA6B3BC|nr:hypothetical protein [Hanstruepera marina]
MRQIALALFFTMVTSCNYFDVKKTSSEEILEEELKTFNWSEVDIYPTFSSCDNEKSEEAKKLCFQNILRQAIYKNIKSDTIVVSEYLKDTILIKFQISERGELSVVEMDVDSLTLKEIPNLKALLQNSLDSLPEIYPAIKRRQKVKTAFVLPVVIQAN